MITPNPASEEGLYYIKSISIWVNGVMYLENIPRIVMEYDDDCNFGSVGIYGNKIKKSDVHHWCLDMSRTIFSGAFPMVGTNDVKISVYCSVTCEKTNENLTNDEVLQIYHGYFGGLKPTEIENDNTEA